LRTATRFRYAKQARQGKGWPDIAAPPTREPFAVRRESADGELVLRLTGELDMATTPSLEEAISAAERDPGLDVVVDLSDLSFLDCTAVHTLAEAHRRAIENGRTFAVTRPRAWVRKVFEMTGTGHLVRPEPDGSS
jgi:anti-anti-sigma factor